MSVSGSWLTASRTRGWRVAALGTILLVAVTGCTSSSESQPTATVSSTSAAVSPPPSSASESRDSSNPTVCPAGFKIKVAIQTYFDVDSIDASDFAPGHSVDEAGTSEPDDYDCGVYAEKDGKPAVIVNLIHNRKLSWADAQADWQAFEPTTSLEKKGRLELGSVEAIFTQSVTRRSYIRFPAPTVAEGTYSIEFFIGDADGQFAFSKTFAAGVYALAAGGVTAGPPVIQQGGAPTSTAVVTPAPTSIERDNEGAQQLPAPPVTIPNSAGGSTVVTYSPIASYSAPYDASSVDKKDPVKVIVAFIYFLRSNPRNEGEANAAALALPGIKSEVHSAWLQMHPDGSKNVPFNLEEAYINVVPNIPSSQLVTVRALIKLGSTDLITWRAGLQSDGTWKVLTDVGGHAG